MDGTRDRDARSRSLASIFVSIRRCAIDVTRDERWHGVVVGVVVVEVEVGVEVEMEMEIEIEIEAEGWFEVEME